jgi:hypothetical protein
MREGLSLGAVAPRLTGVHACPYKKDVGVTEES